MFRTSLPQKSGIQQKGWCSERINQLFQTSIADDINFCCQLWAFYLLWRFRVALTDGIKIVPVLERPRTYILGSKLLGFVCLLQ
jgi:hypothetical protein